MLRLWPNHCLVLLSADKIAVTQRTGLRKIGNVSKTIEIANPHALSWQVTLQELKQVLINLRLPPNTALHVILGSDLVRYATLPAHNISMRYAEKLSYAQAIYSQTYGAEAADWRITCDDVAPSENTVVAAIDQALFTALAALAVEHQLKLLSVQPYLMGAFNALSHAIKQANALLIIVEDSRFLLVNVKNGLCEKVKSIKFTQDDLEQQLTRTLEREKLYADIDTHHAYLYAPMQKTLALKSLQGWNVTRLNAHKNDAKQLKLDFIDKKYFSPRRISKSGFILLLVSLILTAYLVQQYQAKLAVHQSQHAVFSAAFSAKKALQKPALRRIYSAEDQQEMQEILVKLAMPWNQLLNALETIEVKDLSLLSLEPNVKNKQILLKGQSKNLPAALEYVEALEKLPMLSHVYLQKHLIEQSVAAKPVRFEIIAKWQ